MSVNGFVKGSLDNVSFKIFSESFDMKSKIQDLEKNDIELINANARVSVKRERVSKFVPIKLTKEEVERAHECQKVMLNFAYRQFKSSIGTDKEETMKKMYNDALIDYEDFLALHKDALE